MHHKKTPYTKKVYNYIEMSKFSVNIFFDINYFEVKLLMVLTIGPFRYPIFLLWNHFLPQKWKKTLSTNPLVDNNLKPVFSNKSRNFVQFLYRNKWEYKKCLWYVFSNFESTNLCFFSYFFFLFFFLNKVKSKNVSRTIYVHKKRHY